MNLAAAENRRLQLTQLAIEAGDVLLFAVRLDGRIHFVNEAVADLLGYEARVLETGRIEVLGSAFAETVLAALGSASALAGDKVRLECEAERADGSKVPLGLGLVRIESDGQPLGILIASDLSGREAAREVQQRTQEMMIRSQKMEAIGLLAGGVAHDFNNLLAIVGSGVELLELRPWLTRADRDVLASIREATDSGARLTRQLLSFSMKQAVSPRVVDLGVCVLGLVPLLESAAGNGVTLRVEPRAPSATVRIDPKQLEQAVLDLVINSRDAMPKGGELTIRTARRTIRGPVAGAIEPIPHGEYGEIEVCDTGVGMPPEVARRAFEPFFSTKALGHGTGLGLATVFGIVRQSGGFLALESEVGRGTTASLLFPFVCEERATPAEPSSSLPLGQQEVILYVEDDSELRRLTALLVAGLGYKVLAARDGREAMAIAATQPRIDLLLTDVVLPGESGFEISKRLQAARPELKVLFVSGYTDDAEMLRDVVEGKRLLLSKPFDRRALAQSLADALAGNDLPAN